MSQRGTVAARDQGSARAQSLAHAVAEHARSQPDAAALIWRHERITYQQLIGMAEAAQAQLVRADLPSSGPVAILAKKSPDALAIVLACLMARRPFLLPSVDLGVETLGALLRGVGCVAALSPEAEGEAGYASLVTHTLWPDEADSAAAAERDRGTPEADETTFMLTTSGSTGLPKTVPLSAGAVERFTEWAADAFDLGPGVNVLNYAPLNFDLCLLDIWATLRAGGCVVLVDQDRAANPRYLEDVLVRDEPHVVQAVPMLYELLAEANGRSGRTFDSVRHVIFTGDVLPARTLQALPGLFPAARLYNVYGCTETNDSFVLELGPEQLAGVGSMPIGDPIAGVTAVVVDGGDRVLSGPATGELWVSTPFQTTGYLGDAASGDKFVPRSEGGHDRVYFRTGDIVERGDDGRITLHGRNDFQLKVRGVRVNLLEVERAIVGCPGIAEAAVVAVPDEVATNRLQALVVREEGAEVDSLSLRAHCAERLPRAAIPSTFELIGTPLPRTPNGKVDRQAITGRFRTATGGTR